MQQQKEIDLKLAMDVIKEENIKHILQAGEVGCVVDWEVKDKDGKVTAQGSKKCESFVRQFLELMWIVMQPYQRGPVGVVTTWPVTDTGGAARNIGGSGELFATNAGAGDVTFGPVVGTGVGAPTVNDFRLLPLIAHGGGGGQLQYSAVTYGAPASDASVSQFTITRNYANASGAGITVTEIGLYCKAIEAGVVRYFMTIRDVIGGGIAVPNGQTLTLNFRIQASI